MTQKDILIILGTAHLDTTAGKRSPDGRLREARYSRERIQSIAAKLKAQGYNVEIDYPDLQPTARINSTSQTTMQSRELVYRCEVVNNLCKKWGKDKCIYVSLHCNAAGSGSKWMQAGGWCAYTSVGKTKADALAECLYDAAEKHLTGYAAQMAELKTKGVYSSAQKPFRTDKTDGDRDIESNFYVLYHTQCPAVLTENLFQDNEADVAFLLSDEGKEVIENIHIDGIKNYIASITK